MSKPTVLSLFSGIGGFDLGLECAGFQVVAQAENGAKDGLRYKALGNAVTVPVIEYLGLRLMEVL